MCVQSKGVPGKKKRKSFQEEEEEAKRKEHIKGHEKLVKEHDEVVKKLKADLDQVCINKNCIVAVSDDYVELGGDHACISGIDYVELG